MNSYEIAATSADGSRIHVLIGGPSVGRFIQNLIDTGADRIAIKLDEGLTAEQHAALLKEAFPEQPALVMPTAPAEPEPLRPIKLRTKFNGKLRRAIRAWINHDTDYESYMDDLGTVVNEDEWEVICAVFDKLEFEFHSGNDVSIMPAMEMASEVRRELAERGNKTNE